MMVKNEVACGTDPWRGICKTVFKMQNAVSDEDSGFYKMNFKE